MSWEEIWKKAQANEKKPKRRSYNRHVESNLQQGCVNWFRLQYPKLWLLLFAVPNGGNRPKKTYVTKSGAVRTYCPEGAAMKKEGVLKGVSDLILLVANKGFHGLCIEMKTTERGSGQEDEQKEWQRAVELHGYKYIVCRTLEEFINAVNWYLEGYQLPQT